MSALSCEARFTDSLHRAFPLLRRQLPRLVPGSQKGQLPAAAAVTADGESPIGAWPRTTAEWLRSGDSAAFHDGLRERAVRAWRIKQAHDEATRVVLSA